MGYNTSVIILNDALGSIEKDTEFGKKVCDAVCRLSGKGDIDISSGCNVNAATVIETHHADFTTLLAFGGNCVSVLGSIYDYKHNEAEVQVRLLQEAADKLGYKLVKKTVTCLHPNKKKV